MCKRQSPSYRLLEQQDGSQIFILTSLFGGTALSTSKRHCDKNTNSRVPYSWSYNPCFVPSNLPRTHVFKMISNHAVDSGCLRGRYLEHCSGKTNVYSFILIQYKVVQTHGKSNVCDLFVSISYRSTLRQLVCWLTVHITMGLVCYCSI